MNFTAKKFRTPTMLILSVFLLFRILKEPPENGLPAFLVSNFGLVYSISIDVRRGVMDIDFE